MKTLISCASALALLWSTFTAVQAQCESNFDFGEVAFGVSPDPAAGETFLDGMLEEDYYDVLHILIPATAAGIDSTYPPTLPVDSVIVLEDMVSADGIYSGVVFTDTVTNEVFHADEIGLEVALNNNGDSPNGNTFLGGLQYCAAIQGVPSRSGIYRISIDIEAWATIFTPFNAPFTFDNFTLRVNCPLLQGVDVVNANSLNGTQGSLSVTLAEGVVATEIAWFNSSGLQIGTGDSVTVDNPGTFSVMVTTEDCQSLFGGWVVIDEGLDCAMTAAVEITNADEGEENGIASVVVEGATGPWSANWYGSTGLLIGTGESVGGLAEGTYSVLVTDSLGCSAEVESFDVLTSLDLLVSYAWEIFPNPASGAISLRNMPQDGTWSIVTLDGRIVAEGGPANAEGIAVGSLPNGVYLVRVDGSQRTQTKRLVIRH
ncbi:MAG: T9SS type A sorting domain-containing protein [Flavobacteriales bacterium]